MGDVGRHHRRPQQQASSIGQEDSVFKRFSFTAYFRYYARLLLQDDLIARGRLYLSSGQLPRFVLEQVAAWVLYQSCAERASFVAPLLFLSPVFIHG